jgi:hypothetical protein
MSRSRRANTADRSGNRRSRCSRSRAAVASACLFHSRRLSTVKRCVSLSTSFPSVWHSQIPLSAEIDFDVEIFRDFTSTGVFFKVQLKSSESSKYSPTGDYVIQRMDRSNAIRLCEELRTPAILIHADVRSGRSFWLATQIDSTAIRCAGSKQSKTVTLRIPTANELPQTLDEMIRAVTRAEQVLASKTIIEAPVRQFLSSVTGNIPEEDLLREFKCKADAVKLMRAQELFLSGSTAEALARARAVIGDAESSVETRFWAALWAERFELAETIRTQEPQTEIPRLRLRASRHLKRLAKDGPSALKFFALIAHRAAKLESYVYREVGLLMNWRVQSRLGDSVWLAQLAFERAASYRRIVRAYNQCVRLPNYATNSRDRWALGLPLTRIVEAVPMWIYCLATEGLEQASKNCVASSIQICRRAAWIAEETGDDDCLFSAASAALMVSREAGGEALAFAREVSNKLRGPDAKARLDKMIGDREAFLAGNRPKQDLEVVARQAYENMAGALGIDPTEDNPLTRALRLGIADINPERVLKSCKELFVSRGRPTPVALMLGLPSAGEKVIHSTLHNHAVRGATLDTAYEQFSSVYCDRCADRSPHPSAWRYSDEWQQAENRKHTEFMEAFWGRAAG